MTATVIKLEVLDEEVSWHLEIVKNSCKKYSIIGIMHSLGCLHERGFTSDWIALQVEQSSASIDNHLSLLKLDPQIRELLAPVSSFVSDGDNTFVIDGKKIIPGCRSAKKVKARRRSETVLAISIGFLLARLPVHDQKTAVVEIFERGLSYARAREYILELCHARQQGYRKSISPTKNNFEIIQNLIQDAVEFTEKYQSMSPSSLRSILLARKASGCGRIVRSAKLLLADLAEIQKVVGVSVFAPQKNEESSWGGNSVNEFDLLQEFMQETINGLGVFKKMGIVKFSNLTSAQNPESIAALAKNIQKLCITLRRFGDIASRI